MHPDVRFTEYAMQLVPTSVLQVATCCVLTALYAIPKLFDAPPRVFVGPFVQQHMTMTPSPCWVVVDASSTAETWQTVMQEYRKIEQGLFFHFSAADYLKKILFVKYVSRPDTG